MSTSPLMFIGIPHSRPDLDAAFHRFANDDLSHVHIEPITVFDGKNIPQWNFAKAYFVHVTPNDRAFNQLVSEFGGNDGSDLDAILLGYKTREYFQEMFETLLEKAR